MTALSTEKTDGSPGNGANPARGRGPWLEREQVFGWLMSLPGVLVLFVTTTVPLGYLLWTSLRRYNLSDPAGNGFVGLGNYLQLITDDRFWASLARSGVYTVSTVVGQLVIGLGLALLVGRINRGRALVRVAAIMPIMLAPVVVGLVWSTLLLTPDYGVVDFVTQSVGLGKHAWLGDPTLAFVAVIVMHTWQWTPFAFLVFLAALAAFPTEIEEASKLDGANAWQHFIHILLPFLRPTIVVVTIIRTVIALSAFDAIYAATGGGPGTATEILNLYAYRVTFAELDIGYGSALAVVLLILTAVIAALFSRIRRSA